MAVSQTYYYSRLDCAADSNSMLLLLMLQRLMSGFKTSLQHRIKAPLKPHQRAHTRPVRRPDELNDEIGMGTDGPRIPAGVHGRIVMPGSEPQSYSPRNTFEVLWFIYRHKLTEH